MSKRGQRHERRAGYPIEETNKCWIRRHFHNVCESLGKHAEAVAWLNSPNPYLLVLRFAAEIVIEDGCHVGSPSSCAATLVSKLL